ncbi:MAG: S9 family peptidase [Haliscomenobacter sp.]|nr:S9 family peptidase [Haliscomenobacter sp.]
MKRLTWICSVLAIIALGAPFVSQGQSVESLQKEIQSLRQQISNLSHDFDGLGKNIDDLLWFDRVGDVAHVDKVTLTGPPIGKEKINQLRGANNPELVAINPLNFKAYIFIPKDIDPAKKYPLLVFSHGGVHGNFETGYTHIIREMMAQQYIVIAPEYRGSSGYGRGFYENIDYGGLEVQDVKAARDYMAENYEIVDPANIGILGWSHGGLITLLNLFDYPQAYKVGFAGVPVSDLIARMGYKTDSYRDGFSAPFHMGKTAFEAVEEYRKRSPAWQAHKLQTPLLVHTNTIDPDVNVLEVEHLIKALKAEGKSFEYEVFQNAAGGHSFDRIDSKQAKTIRLKIYKFLAKYLNPPKPFKDLKSLQQAGYRY